jgi:hypothetical protein
LTVWLTGRFLMDGRLVGLVGGIAGSVIGVKPLIGNWRQFFSECGMARGLRRITWVDPSSGRVEW